MPWSSVSYLISFYILINALFLLAFVFILYNLFSVVQVERSFTSKSDAVFKISQWLFSSLPMRFYLVWQLSPLWPHLFLSLSLVLHKAFGLCHSAILHTHSAGSCLTCCFSDWRPFPHFFLVITCHSLREAFLYSFMQMTSPLSPNTDSISCFSFVQHRNHLIFMQFLSISFH